MSGELRTARLPASGRVLEKLGFRAVRQVERHCVSRRCTVISNRVLLTRQEFAARKRDKAA